MAYDPRVLSIGKIAVGQQLCRLVSSHRVLPLLHPVASDRTSPRECQALSTLGGSSLGRRSDDNDLMDPRAAELLGRPIVAQLGFHGLDGYPHVLPVWFEYRDGELLIASPAAAYKGRALAKDGKPPTLLCEADCDGPIPAYALNIASRRKPSLIVRLTRFLVPIIPWI